VNITVLNVSTVVEKLKAQIDEWPGLEGKVSCQRAAPINQSLTQTPWVGIYRQQQTLEPRTLGYGAGYRRHNISFAVVMQESSLRSGEDCELKMEKLISEVCSAICSDESLRGTVDMLGPEPFLVTYSSYRVEGNSFFQEAVLQFSVVTNVTASEGGA
jgi:hypothetical protein